MRISDWSSDVCSSDLLTFIKGHSLEYKRKLSVDIVVTETLGNYALEENFLETALDARRFLKPGGVIIPGRLRQFVAPVCTPRLQSEIDIWPQVGFDLDLQPARTISLNNMYVRDRSEEHTSELQSLMRISYAVFCLKKKKTKTRETNTEYC